ncbi:MAG: class I SAM-dependent methyltransferase [Candidatus Kapabacteria bacterium]|nr:class I SAM-dependent methyltransferase [Candidatus Kapabacteria bacterium]
MLSLKDERGYNQGFQGTPTNLARMQRRWDFIADAIGPMAGDPAERCVVELGCSHGAWLRYLVGKLGCRGHGVDISEKFISMAREASTDKTNPVFSVLNFTDEAAVLRTFPPNSVDAVVGNGVLHHFEPRLDETLRTIHTILKPGGKLVFIEPNLVNPYVFLIFRFGLFRRLASLEPNEMAFHRWNIRRRVTAAGFRNCTATAGDFLLPNTPEALIRPVVALDSVLQKTFLREVAQSVFVVATKQTE